MRSIVAGGCSSAGGCTGAAGVAGADGCTANPVGTGTSPDTGSAVGSCTAGAIGIAGGAGSVGGYGPGSKVGDAGRSGCSLARGVRCVGSCSWIRALPRRGSRRCGGVSDARGKVCCRHCALSRGVWFLGNRRCIRRGLGGERPRRRFCAGPRYAAAGGEQPRMDRGGMGKWPAASLGLHVPGSGGHPWSSRSLHSNISRRHSSCVVLQHRG